MDVTWHCLCKVTRPPSGLDGKDGVIWRESLRTSIVDASHEMWQSIQPLTAALDAERASEVTTDFTYSRRAAATIAQVVQTSLPWYFADATAVSLANTLVRLFQERTHA
jgi:hypothetical protein